MSYIYINPYKSSYLAAKQELEQRKREVEFATQRIAYLEQTIRALEPLAEETGITPAGGLPEICSQVLMRMGGIGMTAEDVKQALAHLGVDISGYSNPLAVLHTTLTRLCKAGSGFVKGRTEQGEPMYGYDPQQSTNLGIWGSLSDMANPSDVSAFVAGRRYKKE
jgi:hypothetical protein